MNLDHLPFNWFDVLLLGVLFLGITRGRKRGLSQELFTLLLWIVLIFGCSFAYGPLSSLLTSVTPFSSLFCNILSYLVVAAAVSIGFLALKHPVFNKAFNADSFGSAEYYVGMPAGALRFLCILVAFLALINARLYSRAEIIANEKYQKEVYGSEFFPGLDSLQTDIFARSFTGPYIKEYLSFLLITPMPPQTKPLPRAEEKWM